MQVAQSLNLNRATELSSLFNKLCVKYGVTTTDQFDEFLANVTQESGEFAHKVENMNYRAVTLRKVWPSRFPTLDIANQYAMQPIKLANFVYGDRMGNNQPGDGWQFRGGGFIGLTGREVYSKYANYLGKNVIETSDWVRNTDEGALDSAFWFFYVLKSLKDEAEKDDIIGIIKSINGGLIGKDVRLMYYKRAQNALK